MYEQMTVQELISLLQSGIEQGMWTADSTVFAVNNNEDSWDVVGIDESQDDPMNEVYLKLA